MMRFFITTLFALSLVAGGMNMSVPMALAQQPCVDDAGNPCAEVPAAPTIAGTSEDSPTAVTLGDDGAPILTFIMGLFAWLLGIAAVTLDAAVYHTVLTMGDYIKDLSAIGITWTILRDIGNIALIFGFLMAGINIILGTHFYGEGQKLIPTLIIVAVSLNFSLFVAEAVIDTGNMFATQVYTAINKGEQAGLLTNNLINNPTEAGSQGVGGIIMAQMGLQTIYGEAMTNPTIFESTTPVYIAFMAIILFLITAFVLFSLAFILVARFVILILVIITSPIGFIGYAIPPMKAKAQLWWHTLFSQTITAPVLMLSLYVALSVITSDTFFSGFGGSGLDGSEVNWTKLATEPAGFGGMVITFLVAMGLLLAVNMMAKELSAFGASGAMSLAGKASFGVAGWGARRSVGWLANAGSKYVSGTRFARVPYVGTGLVKGLHGVAHSSFDLRGVKTLNGIKGAGIEGGDAQKGGYLADLKVATDARVEYAKSLHGHELEGEDKVKQALLQNEIKRIKKDRGNAKTEQAIKDFDEDLKKFESQLEDLESHTDAGLQRSYAKVLKGDLRALNLGIDVDMSKNPVFKFINLAQNDDAAKKILADTKKSKGAKGLEAAIKELKDEEGASETKHADAHQTEPAHAEPTHEEAPHAPAQGGGDHHH